MTDEFDVTKWPEGHGYQGNGVSGCDALLAGKVRCGAGHSQHPAGLTDAERLAAYEAYIKVLEPMAKALRAKVTEDMGVRRVERVGAYLPGGVKMATVGYSDGRKTARVTDEAAALKWCLDKYPSEVQTVQSIRPAFLKILLDVAKSAGEGVDAQTGEVLDFIEVGHGSPYITVTTTKEGVDRMATLALRFAGSLEAAS